MFVGAAQAEISDNTVKIGYLADMSGTYRDLAGPNGQTALEMAIADFGGTVNGAKIEVFEYKDGKVGRLLASTTSDAFGDYKLEFESSSMPLYVVAQQGSYTDPLTKGQSL